MSEYYQDRHRYDDIIDLPHYQSPNREHMSLHDRAAQFAPFAALTGYEDAIGETQKHTEQRVEAEIIHEINEEEWKDGDAAWRGN